MTGQNAQDLIRRQEKLSPLFVKGSAGEEKEIIQSVNRAPMLMHSERSLDPYRVLDERIGLPGSPFQAPGQ